MSTWLTVASAFELLDAVTHEGARVEIEGEIGGMPMTTLAPGVHLRGGRLRYGAKGVRLTRDNVLEGVTIVTAEHELAILNDCTQATLGTLILDAVQTVGQVCLIAADEVQAGHVEVNRLHIARADVRGRSDRPHGFGVDAMQGGFTLWNRRRQPSRITARLLDISAGSEASPIRGSGVFIAGDSAGTGRVEVDLLRTGEIHSDGGIAPGTPDVISGGVFVISGARVDEVVNTGSVTTYGQNDMVLDNWGTVTKWTAKGAVTPHGPSGIGFVNFGDIEQLRVEGLIVTHGAGARGFNLYDGSLPHACFAGIQTTGDGAVGIQVAKELPLIEISGDLITSGGEGTSLVKGVQTKLEATALSVQEGGHVGEVRIGGTLSTSGDRVTTLDVQGSLDRVHVAGGILAGGRGSATVRARSDIAGLSDATASARADGRP